MIATASADARMAIDALECSYCAEPEIAETIHVVPGLHTRPVGVRFCCADHDCGGYWFHADSWISGPPHLHDPSRAFTMRDRLLAKSGDGTLEWARSAGHVRAFARCF